MNVANMSSTAVAVVICLAISICTASCQQSPESKSEAIEASILLEDVYPWRNDGSIPADEESRVIPEQFKGQLRLDRVLQPGSRQLLKLYLVNGTDLHFRYDRITVSCGCAGGQFPGGEIPPRGGVRGELTVTVPGNRRNHEVMVSFWNRDATCGTLNVSFEVAGHLGMERSLEELRFEGDSGTWRLPGSFSFPVEFEHLEVRKGDSLRDIDVRLEPGANRGSFQVVIAASGAVTGDEGVSGTVTVSEPLLKLSFPVTIQIRRSGPFQFSPTVLYFRPDPEVRDVLFATALLNIAPAKDGAAKEAGPDFSLPGTISASIRGQRLDVQVTRLSGRVLRLQIRSPRNGLDGKDDSKIEWSLNLAGDTHRFSSSFHVRSD